MRKAVVLFSGGQDSTTVLAQAVKEWGPANVYPLSVDYKQRHDVELTQALLINSKLTTNSIKKIKISFLAKFCDSALLTDQLNVNDKHRLSEHLPASYVPNRNATFLTVAHSYALTIGASYIYAGMCETDYSGYPDCRANFVTAMQDTLNMGANSNIAIIAPLMYLDKASTFYLAKKLGVLDLVLEHSHTCYNGHRTERHDWGYGCDTCAACELRSRGWDKYLLEIMEGNYE